jgi:hypothetical protein
LAKGDDSGGEEGREMNRGEIDKGMAPDVGEGKAEAVETVEEAVIWGYYILRQICPLPSEEVQKPLFRSEFPRDIENVE